MSNEDIIRAWKDAEYRERLSPEEQAALPEHPAGAIELTNDQLNGVAGASTNADLTVGCCPSNFFTYCPGATCVCDTTDPNPTGCCGPVGLLE